MEEVEVEDQKMRLALILSNPDVTMTLMSELLVRTAYQGALSHPLIPDPTQLEHLTPEVGLEHGGQGRRRQCIR